MAEEGSGPAGRSGGLSGRPSSSGVRGGRLPSIRAPRDLTLGGVRKKTFAPNIPARRERPKESKPEQEKATPHGRQKNEKGRGERGRGRGRGRGEVIQSHSIFEQGPAERLNKGRGSSYSVESADRGPSTSSSSSSSGSRSYIKKEKDDPETKRVLDSLLRDDFIESEETVDPEPQLVPVKLPLLDSIKKEVKAEPEEEVKVKKEPVEPDEDHKPSIMELDSNCPSVSHMKKLQEPPKTPVELLLYDTKSEDQLVFIQLPDTLPGNPPQEEDDNPRGPHSRQNQPTSKQAEKQKDDELSNKLDVCHLSDFSEGLIGKLSLHKSGRSTLVLGNTKLDVTMGTPAGFLQNVVSIRTNGDHGNVINLGNVTHKLVCTPDFDHLLSLR